MDDGASFHTLPADTIGLASTLIDNVSGDRDDIAVACARQGTEKMRNTWNTAVVAPQERLAYWQYACAQAFLPLEAENRADQPFSGTIERQIMPHLALSHVHSVESVIRRTGSDISRRSDGSFFANLLLSGSGSVRQFGRSASVGRGGILLVDTDAPFELDFSDRVDLVCVTISAETFRRYLPQPGPFATSAIRPQGAGRLAAAYIKALADDLDDLGNIDDLAADQIASLLARASTEARLTDGSDSLLRRIEQFIAADIGNPDLGAKRICAALGIARSTLFAALARNGKNLGSCIREQRLRHCRAELSDPRQSHLTIREIAARWGFRDPTSFSRCFRRATGTTPRACRPRV
jgi:AraC-like DNA-binding protein